MTVYTTPDADQPSKPSSTSTLPWPAHLTTEHYQHASNRFIGEDKTMVLKAMLSMKTMIGVGALATLFLPFHLRALVVAGLLLPSLAVTLAKRYAGYKSHAEQVHPVVPGTHYGEIDGDFALFIIGAKFNDSMSGDYSGAGSAMQAMQQELEANAEQLGYMSGEMFVSANPTTSSVLFIQYWRSTQQLNHYAKSSMQKHLKPMIKYGRLLQHNPAFGVFHESYQIKAGTYDAIYSNMPRMLLSMAGSLKPIDAKHRTAAKRANVKPGDVEEAVFKQIDDEQ